MVGAIFEKASVTFKCCRGGFCFLHAALLTYCPRVFVPHVPAVDRIDFEPMLTIARLQPEASYAELSLRKARLRSHPHGEMLILVALILGIAYTYSQDNRGKKVSLFVITFNVVWLPLAMLLMTFVMAGPNAALSQLMGLVAAHLYDFLTRLWPEFGGGKNYIQTPNVVKRWFGADKAGFQHRGYGTAYRAGSQAPGRGTSSGFGFSTAWGTRGQGRRLGGE